MCKSEIDWQAAAHELIRLALREDLGSDGDVTTAALIPADQIASVQIVARAQGVLAGLPVARMVFEELDVNGADPGHNPNPRPGERGQAGDLARPLHAHLENQSLVNAGLEAEDGQRHAGLGIEVALRAEDRKARVQRSGEYYSSSISVPQSLALSRSISA